MKILHVVPSFGLGGMEKVLCALINHTADCYRHVVLALDNHTQAAGWIEARHVRCVGFAKPRGRGKFFRALYASLRTIRPALLMTYNWGATDAIWLGRLAGIRRIIHNEHGFNVDEARATRWQRDLVRFLVYRMASRVLVVSDELRAMMQHTYGLQAPQVVCIPNGIDTSLYAPDAIERHRARRALGFQETDFIIGFAGRLDPIKNFALMLDVVVRCMHAHPRCRWLIIGDGPEKQRLETACQARNIWHRVVFMGQQTHVLPYLRAMDAFLLTSCREQMPLTVLEAMAVGVPVVASRVGEIPHIIDDGINGFIRSVQDRAEMFAQALGALMPPARRQSMGQAARQKVTTSFQQQAMVQSYSALLSELSAAPQPYMPISSVLRQCPPLRAPGSSPAPEATLERGARRENPGEPV